MGRNPLAGNAPVVFQQPTRSPTQQEPICCNKNARPMSRATNWIAQFKLKKCWISTIKLNPIYTARFLIMQTEILSGEQLYVLAGKSGRDTVEQSHALACEEAATVADG